MNRIPFLDQLPISEELSFAGISIIGLVLIVLLIRLLSKPISKMLKLLIHAVFGFILLFALNFFVPGTELQLEINLPNCIVAGVGGIPGVILLLLYKYFMPENPFIS